MLSETDQKVRDQVVAALREHQGNVSAVARALDKDRKQIQRWIKRFGLDPSQLPIAGTDRVRRGTRDPGTNCARLLARTLAWTVLMRRPHRAPARSLPLLSAKEHSLPAGAQCTYNPVTRDDSA